MTRADLKPGQVFALPFAYLVEPWQTHQPRGVFVVLDKTTEVEFWTGARFAIGDVAPAWEVEAL